MKCLPINGVDLEEIIFTTVGHVGGLFGRNRKREEALAVALYAALVASDFSDAIRIASNHDGDSDSTASIAGQIYGAWRRLEEIPNAWIRRLDALDPLLDVMQQMLDGLGQESRRSPAIA